MSMVGVLWSVGGACGVSSNGHIYIYIFILIDADVFSLSSFEFDLQMNHSKPACNRLFLTTLPTPLPYPHASRKV